LCQVLTDLQNLFTRFLGTFSVNWLLKIPTTPAHVAALPCETLMPKKQAITDQLHGSLATYLGFGGVVNNQRKK